jgi:hypothetical protein
MAPTGRVPRAMYQHFFAEVSAPLLVASGPLEFRRRPDLPAAEKVVRSPLAPLGGEGRWPPLSHPGFPRLEARRRGVDVRALELGLVRRLKDL